MKQYISLLLHNKLILQNTKRIPYSQKKISKVRENRSKMPEYSNFKRTVTAKETDKYISSRPHKTTIDSFSTNEPWKILENTYPHL